MSKFKLVINFKTYEESTGERALLIAKACLELRDLADKKNVDIVLVPQLIDIKEISKLGILTYSQHVDSNSYGANTGYVIADSLKSISVQGSLVSHSEHLLSIKDIKQRVDKLNSLGMDSCVCARDALIAKEIAKLNPSYIAVEPQDLIGGDISVSTAKPDLIKESVLATHPIPLLVGAGVKNSSDVKKSIELGAKGVLVASGVVKVEDFKGAIEDLLNGF